MSFSTDDLCRAFFEQVPIGFVVARFDGRFLLVNEAFAAIHGHTVDETLKLRYQNITPSKYEDADREQMSQLKIKGYVPPFDKQYIRKDESLVPIRLMLGTLSIDGEDCVWSLVENISSDAGVTSPSGWLFPGLYQELFQRVPLAMALTDELGRFIDVNQAYADLIGRTVEEALKLSFWDITPPEYHRQNQEEINRLGETGSFGPFTKQYLKKEEGDQQSRIFVTLFGATLKIHNERYTWVVCLPHLPNSTSELERDTKFGGHVLGLAGGTKKKLGLVPMVPFEADEGGSQVALHGSATETSPPGAPEPESTNLDPIKVMFTFDRQSYSVLQNIMDIAAFGSEARTVREALQIMRALQKQAEKGYSEVVVQSPETGEQKILELDLLKLNKRLESRRTGHID
jgi:PAS domain S-box-containing protein